MIDYTLPERKVTIGAQFVVFWVMWIQEKLLSSIKLEKRTFKKDKLEELLNKLALPSSLMKNYSWK